MRLGSIEGIGAYEFVLPKLLIDTDNGKDAHITLMQDLWNLWAECMNCKCDFCDNRLNSYKLEIWLIVMFWIKIDLIFEVLFYLFWFVFEMRSHFFLLYLDSPLHFPHLRKITKIELTSGWIDLIIRKTNHAIDLKNQIFMLRYSSLCLAFYLNWLWLTTS